MRTDWSRVGKRSDEPSATLTFFPCLPLLTIADNMIILQEKRHPSPVALIPSLVLSNKILTYSKTLCPRKVKSRLRNRYPSLLLLTFSTLPPRCRPCWTNLVSELQVRDRKIIIVTISCHVLYSAHGHFSNCRSA